MTNHILYKKSVEKKDVAYLLWTSYVLLRAMYGPRMNKKYMDQIKKKFGTLNIEDHSEAFYALHPKAKRRSIIFPHIPDDEEVSKDTVDALSEMSSGPIDNDEEDNNLPEISTTKRKTTSDKDCTDNVKRQRKEEPTSDKQAPRTNQTLAKDPLAITDPLPKTSITQTRKKESLIQVENILGIIKPGSKTETSPFVQKRSMPSSNTEKPTPPANTSKTSSPKIKPQTSETSKEVSLTLQDVWKAFRDFKKNDVYDLRIDMGLIKRDQQRLWEAIWELQRKVKQLTDNEGKMSSEIQTVLKEFAEVIQQRGEKIDRMDTRLANLEQRMGMEIGEDPLAEE